MATEQSRAWNQWRGPARNGVGDASTLPVKLPSELTRVWQVPVGLGHASPVVVDDVEMKITEVVRGRDLLLSTARQLLLYDAFGETPPDFFHCPLLLDDEGQKLSKSLGSRSIQEHRANGADPGEWTEDFEFFYRNLVQSGGMDGGPA